jgi:hypothetical protein
VDDTVREIRRKLRPQLGKMPDLDSAQAEAVWNVLSDLPGSFNLANLSVAASAGQMRSLAELLAAEAGSSLWQCRPGRGRMSFHLQDEERVGSLLDNLDRWTKQSGQTLVVAYSDLDYEWRVRCLPEDDQHAVSLKLAIKERFDPSGTLNPLVSM